jgi:hypothetical protein
VIGFLGLYPVEKKGKKPERREGYYAGDGEEPPHVHGERDDCEAKFWLVAVGFAGVSDGLTFGQ